MILEQVWVINVELLSWKKQSLFILINIKELQRGDALELLDVYDSSFNYIGYEYRNVVHKNGLWHQTFHCWIVRKRQKRNYLLFQKRASSKSYFPSLLDVTAAGHLIKGEKKEDGFRELTEELGIMADLDSATYLGYRVEVIDLNEHRDKEFQHVYLVNDDTSLLDFHLCLKEVNALVELELEDAYKLFWHELPSIDCKCFENGNVIDYSVTLGDFIPRNISYYRTIIIMAERFIEGDMYLSI